MTLQHILVPMDFSPSSEHALDYALQLAKAFQARITLFHVVETPVLAGGAHMGGAIPSYTEQLEAEASRTIDTYTQRVRDAGLTCEAMIAHAVPFQQIVNLAKARDVDMIVMSTHGRTGLAHMFLGSVAEKVVRLAPCPVLVTRSPHAETAAMTA